MTLKLELPVDDEMLRAQGQEGLADVAEIRRRLLDDAAELGEAPHRLGADLAQSLGDAGAGLGITGGAIGDVSRAT